MRPPAIAKWLLTRLTPENQALIGDLAEEYERRQTRLWYWKQVLLAIAIHFFQDIRHHKFLTLRAAVFGYAMLWVFLRFVHFPLSALDTWLVVKGIADIRMWWPDWPIPYVLVGTCGAVANGWLVGRFHRPPMVCAYALALWLWYLSFLPGIVRRIGSTQYGWELGLPSFLTQTSLALLLVPGGIIVGAMLSETASRRSEGLV